MMSKDVFVYVECKENTARKSSFELLSQGKKIADNLACRLYAVVMGHQIKDIAESLKGFSDTIIVVDDERLKEYRWDTYAAVLESLIKKYSPSMVIGASTVTGKDFFPRLAARFRAPIVSDAIGIDLYNNNAKIKKPIFGGKVISWVECKDSAMIFVTFRPNSFSIEKRDLSSEIVEERVEISQDQRLCSVSVEKSLSRKVDLQEADFIICGGRGMKGAEEFQILEEIAGLMEGRVGASRAVVDSKWRDYDDQVGKSGKTVSPKLYIGCGVSGALHHIMGMDTAKVIVAINKDPNAPIFKYADYGITEDLFSVLPALKEELKMAKEKV
jgi:electron transfer flavoprotein alpha subunit